MSLLEAAKGVQKFQFKYLGYDKHACTSCGALKYVDDETGRLSSLSESCSPRCPWALLQKEIENELLALANEDGDVD